MLDFQSMTLVGLVVFGTVSAISFFKPDMDSRIKFIISLVVALIIGFVPASLGIEAANRIKDAIAAALAVNGLYQGASKVAAKVGAVDNV